MLATFYNFTKRKNSTKQPNMQGESYSVALKEETDNVNPTLVVSSFNPVSKVFTYCLLNFFGRYYYISRIRSINSKTWEIDLSLDPLATWKNEILNTSAFVLYSTNNYDDSIIDNRLSTKAQATYQTSTVQLFDFLDDIMAYVLTYVASQPTFGGSGVAVVSQSVLRNIMSVISDTAYVNYIENSLKSLMGVYDAVIDCIALPYTPRGSAVDNIFLAGYDTGQVGARPDPYNVYEADISIPWQFNDFRNNPPYTSLLLEIPTIGTVELNASDYIGQSSIHLKAVCDNINGNVVVYVGQGQMKLTSNIATKIAIGTVKANALGVVGNSINAITNGVSALTGNGGLGDALTSGFNAIISSVQRSVGVIGSNGSYISSVPSVGEKGVARLISICHNTNVEPYTLANTIGRPLNQSRIINGLNGYCQTVDFEVNGSMSDDLKEQINSAMNGGVFIE